MCGLRVWYICVVYLVLVRVVSSSVQRVGEVGRGIQEDCNTFSLLLSTVCDSCTGRVDISSVVTVAAYIFTNSKCVQMWQIRSMKCIYHCMWSKQIIVNSQKLVKRRWWLKYWYLIFFLFFLSPKRKTHLNINIYYYLFNNLFYKRLLNHLTAILIRIF